MSQSILESAIEYALESGNNAYVFVMKGVEAFTNSKELAESHKDYGTTVNVINPEEVLAEREYQKAYAEARDACLSGDPSFQEEVDDFFQNVREGGLIPDDMDFDGVLNFDDGEVQLF